MVIEEKLLEVGLGVDKPFFYVLDNSFFYVLDNFAAIFEICF